MEEILRSLMEKARKEKRIIILKSRSDLETSLRISPYDLLTLSLGKEKHESLGKEKHEFFLTKFRNFQELHETFFKSFSLPTKKNPKTRYYLSAAIKREEDLPFLF